LNHPGSDGGSVLSGGWRDGPVYECTLVRCVSARPLRRSRTARGLQLPQERHHRDNRPTVAADQPHRLSRIGPHLDRTERRNGQSGQIAVLLSSCSHRRGT